MVLSPYSNRAVYFRYRGTQAQETHRLKMEFLDFEEMTFNQLKEYGHALTEDVLLTSVAYDVDEIDNKYIKHMFNNLKSLSKDEQAEFSANLCEWFKTESETQWRMTRSGLMDRFSAGHEFSHYLFGHEGIIVQYVSIVRQTGFAVF